MDSLFREGAAMLLADQPDPAVAVSALRGLLKAGDDDPRLVAALGALDSNPWVLELAAHQRSDGGWGRFHSREAGSAIPTTEWAVQRCVALGVNARHPIGHRASRYLEDLLGGRLPFPDPPERNDRWETGVALFVSSTLSLLVPEAAVLVPVQDLWSVILQRTFAGGTYDEAEEARAHRELTGASVTASYLQIRNRYALALLGSAQAVVPPAPLMAYADWVAEVGAGYLEMPVKPPTDPSPSELERWLATLELLAPLPGAEERLGTAVGWILDRRGRDGWWDLGPRHPGSPAFPISSDWRSPRRRRHDYTVRILALLAAVGAP